MINVPICPGDLLCQFPNITDQPPKYWLVLIWDLKTNSGTILNDEGKALHWVFLPSKNPTHKNLVLIRDGRQMP